MPLTVTLVAVGVPETIPIRLLLAAAAPVQPPTTIISPAAKSSPKLANVIWLLVKAEIAAPADAFNP